MGLRTIFINLYYDRRKKYFLLLALCLVILIIFFFSQHTPNIFSSNDKPVILIFGGAGYIGSHVLLELIRQKSEEFHPVVFDDLSEGFLASIRSVEKLTNYPGRIDFVRGDINSNEDVDHVFKKYRPTVVFHLCAKISVGESVTDPLKYYENNVGGTINILRSMERYGVSSFVFSSTAALFGLPDEVPIPSDGAIRPINPYGFSKYVIERALEDCDRSWGLKSVCLRYFNAAGADASGSIGESHQTETHLIPIVVDVLEGRRKELLVFGDDYDTRDGTCIRDYVHVTDIAQAHLLATEYLLTHKKSAKVNLGSGNGHSVLEVVHAAEKISGKKVPYRRVSRREGDAAILVASSAEAERVLGWKRQYDDLEDIFSSAYQWHQKHPKGFK